MNFANKPLYTASLGPPLSPVPSGPFHRSNAPATPSIRCHPPPTSQFSGPNSLTVTHFRHSRATIVTGLSDWCLRCTSRYCLGRYPMERVGVVLTLRVRGCLGIGLHVWSGWAYGRGEWWWGSLGTLWEVTRAVVRGLMRGWRGRVKGRSWGK